MASMSNALDNRLIQKRLIRSCVFIWMVALTSFIIISTLIHGGLFLLFGRFRWIEAIIANTSALIVVLYSLLTATKKYLKVERERLQKTQTVSGLDPELGRFTHFPFYNNWWASLVLPSGEKITVHGKGTEPCEHDKALWRKIASQFDQIVQTARDALTDDADKPVNTSILDVNSLFLLEEGGSKYGLVQERFLTSPRLSPQRSSLRICLFKE